MQQIFCQRGGEGFLVSLFYPEISQKHTENWNLNSLLEEYFRLLRNK